MKILSRYLARTITLGTMFTLAVLASLAAFFALIDQLNDLQGDYGIGRALQYVMLLLPRLAYELYPTAVLIGTLLSLGALASNSELVVMRAAGMSVWQITRAVLRAGLLLMVIAILLGEVLAPPAEQLAQNQRAAAQSRAVSVSRGQGFWARDGSLYIQINRVLPDLQLVGLTLYRFDEQQRLLSIVYADSAVYENKAWQLNNVRENVLGEDHLRHTRVPAQEWLTAIKPDMLNALAVDPQFLSLPALYKFILHLSRNKLDSKQYQLALWMKLIKPFSTLVMLLVALPFVFGPLRSSGIGQRLLIGVLLGLGFHMLNQALNHIALGYGIHPVISAMLPSVLFAVGGIVALRRIF